MTPSGPARSIRAEAKIQMRTAILDTARTHLAEHGATGLSLRAVARDVGMVSSALYRYFDSRDALLTAMIVDAYDALGSSVERAEAAVDRRDLSGRWNAITTTTRQWARADPHQYALVYGSPVPGYVAPQDTIGPATRVTRVLSDLLVDVAAAGRDEASSADEPSRELVDAVAPVAEYTGNSLPTDLVVRGVMAWTYLFGAISFELFGQRHNVVADDRQDEFFAEEMRRLAIMLGICT